MDKNILRQQIRQRKRQMTEDEIVSASRRLGERLLEHPLYQQAGTVYGYLPFNQEIRTIPMLCQAMLDGKRIAVPKVFGDRMRFIYLDDLSAVERGYSGIPEPIANEPIAQDSRALVLVPGLAFDCRGYRVGYGRGFYDRFLAQEPEHPTIGLCYAFQLMDWLENDEFDVPVDHVLWA